MSASGYVLVPDSGYRTWESRENPENYYGRLLTPDGIPVICQHGGSMWLCKKCALGIFEQLEAAAVSRTETTK